MKRFYTMAAAASMIVFGASAQEERGWQKFQVEADRVMAQVRTMTINGLVMGPAVKSAPYSATEISENTQVLADGTRIHNESQTFVYRDSEGRVRRETPSQVTIWDPVENVSYILNPKNQTARQVKIATASFRSATPGVPAGGTFTVAVPPPPGAELPRIAIARGVDGEPVDFQYVVRTEVADAKLKAEAIAKAGAEAGVVRARTGGPAQTLPLKSGKEESLGKQSIEGVLADGSRTKLVLEAGAIGNDRPIETINERWFSPELQTVIMTRHSDPRTGEEVFRLTNINRSEPAAYLFQVPSGYQITEQK